MKKGVCLLCVLLLLLCGCSDEVTSPSIIPLSAPQDLSVVLEDFECLLDDALRSDEITYLQLHDVVFTDPDIIKEYLSLLKKLELEPAEGVWLSGPRGHMISLGFINGQIKLGRISESYITIFYYSDRSTSYPKWAPLYQLNILNPEAVDAIFQFGEKYNISQSMRAA